MRQLAVEMVRSTWDMNCPNFIIVYHSQLWIGGVQYHNIIWITENMKRQNNNSFKPNKHFQEQ